MEPKKIRIGNDIKLAVDLRQYLGINNILKERGVYNPQSEDFENIDPDNMVGKGNEVYYNDPSQLMTGNFPYVNRNQDVYYRNSYIDDDGNVLPYRAAEAPVQIRSIKAILVNTSREEVLKRDIKKQTKFITRFPIEPYCEAYSASPYNVHGCGYPTWRAYPYNMFSRYHGFGCNPKFAGLDNPLPMVNDIEYHANVAATSDQHVVEVQFPAEHQLHLGVYKLVIVAKIYVPGYNAQNLKTITIDMPDVFELVGNSKDAIDGDIKLNVYRINNIPYEDEDSTFQGDVYVSNGVLGNNVLTLDRTNGTHVDIDLSSIAGWYEGE